MLLSLLLPLGASFILRMALRPRTQQRQPLQVDLPLEWLVVGWGFSGLVALIAMGPSGIPLEVVLALILGASAIGALIPEFLRGLGQATSSGFSKPKNWGWLVGGALLLYGVFVDPKMLQLLFLGVFFYFLYKFLIGLVTGKGG